MYFKKTTDAEPSKGSIVIYTVKSGVRLKAKLEKDTIWLTQKQISNLFKTERSTITKHLRNILTTKELEEESVCAIFAHTAADGKIYRTNFYNLDAIISIGYRVNSKRATQFRIWATTILKDYLTKGYALNEKRLSEKEKQLTDLQEAINFIKNKASSPQLSGKANELLSILSEYSNALTILYQYDRNILTLQKGKKPHFVLTYKETKKLISNIRESLILKHEATELFGQWITNKLASIVGALYQTFGGIDLYQTIEEKAANLLYLVIKDHPFTDGNKRIASLLFLYFLGRNNYLLKNNGEKKISDTTIVALSLLIANSDPKEKEIMIKIITNLLK